jgi:hypothetical protein
MSQRYQIEQLKMKVELELKMMKKKVVGLIQELEMMLLEN